MSLNNFVQMRAREFGLIKDFRYFNLRITLTDIYIYLYIHTYRSDSQTKFENEDNIIMS